MDPRIIRFSGFLRLWREKRGTKLQVAAADLGVSLAAWSHWETGERMPSLTNLLAIADYMDIPAQCLICGENQVCDMANHRWHATGPPAKDTRLPFQRQCKNGRETRSP
ncbi:MAG: helix-turn-helix domain-containing protein [Terrimicrobiaceae bacterium]